VSSEPGAGQCAGYGLPGPVKCYGLGVRNDTRATRVGKGQYIEIQPEELEAIAIESKRTIEIDEFVPKKEIDELYLNSPCYLAPDGDVGQQAFAVIRALP
jgi:non-homologous end joining protein Ku